MSHKMQWKHVYVCIGSTCWLMPVDQLHYHISASYFLSEFMNPCHSFFLLLAPKEGVTVHFINFKFLLNVFFYVHQIYFKENTFTTGFINFVESNAGSSSWCRVFNDRKTQIHKLLNTINALKY